MKVLLTGKNGQVGFELQRALAPVCALVCVGAKECDMTNATALRDLIRVTAPDVIVNAAAYTAVDRAETDRAAAYAVNSDAMTIIGEEAEKLGAVVIHFSTDYVFDGVQTAPYTEQDAPNPLNIYGQSKLAGERALVAANPSNLILRTSWVVGAHGKNFAKTILRLAAENSELKIVADQYGAPTSAALLADVSAHLVRQLQTNGSAGFPFGMYHVAAGGRTSWHEYAKFIVTQAALAGAEVLAMPDGVLPIGSLDYPTPAKRPKNACLNTNLFTCTFGLQLPHWQHGMAHVLQQIL